MATTSQAVTIPAGEVTLPADLWVPDEAVAVVVFAHGSGSSRHSPRNQQVAAALNRAGFATLLMDLLTGQEEHVDEFSREFRFDIGLLSRRLVAAVDWLARQPATAGLPILTFGASTGAAAALSAAADRPHLVRGVISRGGRPDLAGTALDRLTVPVLLIVGGADPIVVELNDQAAARLRLAGTPVEVAVVQGATHLFGEPGALDAVVGLAIQRCTGWLSPHRPGSPDPG